MPFSPTDLSNLYPWFKADSLALNDNDPVASWTDQSGLGKNAAHGTSANRPLYKTNIANGMPGVLFDGTDDHLFTTSFAAAMSQPTTIFVVAKNTGLDSNQRHMIDGIGPSNRNVIYDSGGTALWGFFAGSTVAATARDSNVVIFSAVFNGASSVLRRNGVQIAAGNPGTNVLTGLALGTSAAGAGGTGNYWKGYLFEVILYNADHSASFATVEAYLAARWAPQPLVAGAVAEWDASKITGLNDGDACSTLEDQIGASDFTGVTTTRPLYKTNIFGSMPALLFDGTDDTMATPTVDLDWDDTGTLFAVVNRGASGGTRQTLFGGEVTDHITMEFGIGSGTGTNRICYIKPGLFFYESVDNALGTGTPAVISIVRSGTNTTAVRVNGAAVSQQVSTSAPSVDTGIVRRLGTRTSSSQPYKGYVAHLIIYSSALSAAEIQHNEQTLASKWNLVLPGSRSAVRRRSRTAGLVYR